MKKEVTSAVDLIEYLETNGQRHKFYYHYTSWDSLVKIYNSKSFLLTRGTARSLNDHHETLVKGTKEIWRKTYIGSFAYGSSENMAMWGLYGLPAQDAVRIAIPKKQMLNWIKNIHSIYLWDGRKGELIENIKVTLTDIVYAQKKETLRLWHDGDRLALNKDVDLNNIDKRPEMTGYVKNSAWSYEKETRIKIELPQEYEYDKIFVDIPDEVIQSLLITIGPCFKSKYDDLYRQLTEKEVIMKSEFFGLLNYKTLCSMCRYQFEKEENRWT